jgi:4-amino-4-deoxy-L-arabinose transferase-like glycosyltransferase
MHRAQWIGLRLAVAGLLSAHGLLAVSSVRQKSPTFDETRYVVGGVSLWKTGDHRILATVPPLARLWATIPVLLGRFAFPEELLRHPAWHQSNEWSLGVMFLYQSGNPPQAVLTRCRAMIALWSVILGLGVWLWSRRLFGEAGGMISLVLYSLSPTMLAHGSLATTDLAVSLFFVAAAASIWWTLHRVSLLSIGLSGFAVAGLLLSKMTGLIIVPVAAVMIAIRLLSNRPTTIAWRTERVIHSRAGRFAACLLAGLTVSGIVVVLIWGAYGFRYSAMKDALPGRDRLPPDLPEWNEGLGRMGLAGSLIEWTRDHKLLPEAYLFGLAHTLRDAKGHGADAFLNGRMRPGGWWYYFPYCFAVKTPLPLFGVLLMAFLAAIALPRGPGGSIQPSESRTGLWAHGLYETAPLWALLAVYWLFAIRSGLNIGIRHLLPVYPVLFIFTGRASSWMEPAHRVTRWIPPALIVLFAVASFSIRPHYLAYFNYLAGGPQNAWKHLVDSSLDWGQDLPGLKHWLDHHDLRQPGRGTAGPRPRLYLSYLGTAIPKFYGIEATVLPEFPQAEKVWSGPLTGGIYCISASMLQQYGLLPTCRWTRALEAEYQDLRGRYSILIASVPSGPSTPRSPGMTKEEAELNRFLNLRFARLCARLRQRGPDDNVGYSILIYVLKDSEVKQALEGEPAELVQDETR